MVWRGNVWEGVVDLGAVTQGEGGLEEVLVTAWTTRNRRVNAVEPAMKR